MVTSLKPETHCILNPLTVFVLFINALIESNSDFFYCFVSIVSKKIFQKIIFTLTVPDNTPDNAVLLHDFSC